MQGPGNHAYDFRVFNDSCVQKGGEKRDGKVKNVKCYKNVKKMLKFSKFFIILYYILWNCTEMFPTKFLFCAFLLKKAELCCMINHICGDLNNNIRIGGKMKLKKVGSAFLATMLTCSLTVTPVFADEVDDLKDQKEQAQSEMNSLQSQLNTLMDKISELESDLIETGEEIAKTEEDLKAAEEDQEQQYEAMKLRIKYMYEEGSGSATIEKVFTSGDMSSMLSQAEYSQQVHTYDREKLDEYIATTKKIEELKSSLEEKQDNLEATQVEFEAQQSELNTTISEKSEEISNLDGMIQEAARKAAEEAARKKAEEEAKRKQEEERASQETAQDNGGSTGGTSTPAAEEDYEEPSGGGSDNGGNSNGGSGGSSEPSYSESTGNAIVDRAYSCLGAAYVWGACNPGAFDCSGLVSYCLTGSYSRIGTSSTFLGWPRVSNPQPGDVCAGVGHCGIYIGNGQMIHAATEGVGVIIGPVQSGMVYVRA